MMVVQLSMVMLKLDTLGAQSWLPRVEGDIVWEVKFKFLRVMAVKLYNNLNAKFLIV